MSSFLSAAALTKAARCAAFSIPPASPHISPNVLPPPVAALIRPSSSPGWRSSAMLIFISFLVFIVVTLAVFAGISLYDERKAQARVLRDRLSSVWQPADPPVPDAALLRDEVLSQIPAFDSWLRRSERVSVLQKMLAQGSVDVRAGNFLMLCAVSSVAFALIAVFAGGRFEFGWAGALLG